MEKVTMKWSNNKLRLVLKLSSKFPESAFAKMFTDKITEGIINGKIKIGMTSVFALEYMDNADTNVPTQA